jgi:hypothetical protein
MMDGDTSTVSVPEKSGIVSWDRNECNRAKVLKRVKYKSEKGQGMIFHPYTPGAQTLADMFDSQTLPA